MRLLDEIGLEEAAYAAISERCRRLEIQFDTHFKVSLGVPEMFARDHVYGIDRASFDHVLWARLARFPSVTARRGFAFLDLVRDADGTVIGIEGQEGDGPRESIRARCVVGADGRFRLVAKRAGAKVTDDHPDHTSTVYFADWDDVGSPTEDRPTQIFATCRGTNVMFFPAPAGRLTVATRMRADRVDVEGLFARAAARSSCEALRLGRTEWPCAWPGGPRKTSAAPRSTPRRGRHARRRSDGSAARPGRS